MTSPNRNSIDEELLQELGLGNPELEGETWDLDELDPNQEPPEDFMETLDALRLLQEMGRLELEQHPPKLEPPRQDEGTDAVSELLKLLEQEPPPKTSTGLSDAPKLEPPN